VRISDELGKPILYKHNSNQDRESKFWVIDESRNYILDLNEYAENQHIFTAREKNSLKDKVKAPVEKSKDPKVTKWESI
jgi:hypothetical protein